MSTYAQWRAAGEAASQMGHFKFIDRARACWAGLRSWWRRRRRPAPPPPRFRRPNRRPRGVLAEAAIEIGLILAGSTAAVVAAAIAAMWWVVS